MGASGWLTFGSAVALVSTGGVLLHYSFRPWWKTAEGIWLWGKLFTLFSIFVAVFVGRMLGNGIGLVAWAILINALGGLQAAMAVLYIRAQHRRRRRERGDIDSSISRAIIEP